MAEAVAAVLAPEIDRTVLAVGTRAGHRHAQRFAAATSDMTQPARALLPRIADFLDDGPIPRGFVAERIPYTAVEVVESGLDELIALGHIAQTGEELSASPSLLPAIVGVLDGRAEMAAELWRDARPIVDRLTVLAGEVRKHVPAEAAVARRHARLSESTDPWFLLYERLTTIRYIRADAHRAAWGRHALDGPAMAQLTTAWQGGTPADPTQLQARGWWDGALTADGQAIRDQIEADTNIQNDEWLSPSGPSVIEHIITALPDLPGTPVSRPI